MRAQRAVILAPIVLIPRLCRTQLIPKNDNHPQTEAYVLLMYQPRKQLLLPEHNHPTSLARLQPQPHATVYLPQGQMQSRAESRYFRYGRRSAYLAGERGGIRDEPQRLPESGMVREHVGRESGENGRRTIKQGRKR